LIPGLLKNKNDPFFKKSMQKVFYVAIFPLSRLLFAVAKFENDVISLNDENMVDFLNYFKKAYFGFIDQNNVFKKALFPKENWNCFGSRA
jgi:hypothetical protein